VRLNGTGAPTDPSAGTVEQTYARAKQAFAAGALADAESLCRTVVGVRPHDARANVLLGDVLSAAGRIPEALAAYDRACQLNPGFALGFTRSSVIRFRQRFGAPPKPRVPPPGRDRVQMTTLGGNGRFGNQLLQYAFVKLYAQRHQLTLEVPDWIGRDLFDLDDPLPSMPLPVVDDGEADLFASLQGRAEILRNVNVRGYFAGNSRGWAGFEQDFRKLFTPGRHVRPLLKAALGRLRDGGRTLVAVHLRRGDFGHGRFWVAPPAWYLDWLRELWPTLARPILFVATDQPDLLAPFGGFDPVGSRELGCEIPGADYLLDHYLLSEADYLAVSNSSFSFTAAMLNVRARQFLRPHPDRRAMVAFEPWNAPVLLDPAVEAGSVPTIELNLIRQLVGPADVVVHVGQFCSPWTNAMRSAHPAVRVFELGEDASLDEFREHTGHGRINHVVVERAGALGSLVHGAQRTFGAARPDVLHFRLTPDEAAPVALPLLRDLGYCLFLVSEAGFAPVHPETARGPASFLAVQEEWLPQLDRRTLD